MQDWLKNGNVLGSYFPDFTLLDTLRETLNRYLLARIDVPFVNPITYCKRYLRMVIFSYLILLLVDYIM